MTIFLTYNLLTIASFRIGGPSILFFAEISDNNIFGGIRSARNKNVPHIFVIPCPAQTTTTHPGSHVMREAKIRLKSMSLESPADSIIA